MPMLTESISGANFSFNLYQMSRTEKKQTGLYYRIIEAYLTKIVIIDERLCPIETSFADELLQLNIANSDSFINKYILKSRNSYKNKLERIFEQELDISLVVTQLQEWWSKINESDKKKVEIKNSNRTKLRFLQEKNIYAYTLDKLGNLFDSSGECHETLSGVNPHFISIHISLLDKLTNFLNDPDAQTTKKLKYILDKFEVREHTYVAVHSGRGGLTDRNQEVTFIPFANLQWAFENSKYMLSELFHSQVYSRLCLFYYLKGNPS